MTTSPMHTEALGRNLLIIHELERLSRAFNARGLSAVLLKGSALITRFPEYCAERMMEDIDLLFRPGDIPRARELFVSMGYLPAPEDPWAFRHPGRIVPIDIIDGLWYLDRQENHRLFAASLAHPVPDLPSFYHLPADEMYLHVLAHAAIHHAMKGTAWLRDLDIMGKKWGKETSVQALEKKVRAYGLATAFELFVTGAEGKKSLPSRFHRWFLATPTPLKGHLARFIFLPFKRKLPYLFSALFPSKEFLACRYGLTGRMQVMRYRLLRPFLLLAKLAALIVSLK